MSVVSCPLVPLPQFADVVLEGAERTQEEGEGRPVLRLPPPTQPHDVIDLLRGVVRARQHPPLRDVPHHLLVTEAVVGVEGEGEDLPEHDAEGPHVRLGGELVVEDGLEGHPADGDGVVFTAVVERPRVDTAGQPKV